MWTTMTPRTPTRMTRTITTRTICTSEHNSAPLVFLVFITCHTTLAQVVLESVIFTPCRTCVVVLGSLRVLFLSPSSSFSPSSCTLTCTTTSTTSTLWKITWTTPLRGATTPATSFSPSKKHPILGGLLRPSFVSPRRKHGPPCIWNTHGISGNVFANPQPSFSAPYPQELNSLWKKTVEEPRHMSTVEKSGRPERNQDLKCQSGPSAKNSVIFSGWDFSKNYGANQQRLQISDLYFDKFPTPSTFACWKIRFKTEVCTCSQFLTEAMQRIKEVEFVDLADELRFSSSTRGISMQNFELLDARIASAPNKIIQNSQFQIPNENQFGGTKGPQWGPLPLK